LQRIITWLNGKPLVAVLLSRKEREVIRLIARGLMDSEIAHQLHMAPSTLRTHLNRICADTGLRNRTELAMWLLQNPAVARGIGAPPGLHAERCPCGSAYCATMNHLDEPTAA
jgi:DNA-binding CsgD family transcriptional regulator